MKYLSTFFFAMTIYSLTAQQFAETLGNQNIDDYTILDFDQSDLVRQLEIENELRINLSYGSMDQQEVIFVRRYLLSPNYQATRSGSNGIEIIPHPVPHNFIIKHADNGTQIGRVNLTGGRLNGLLFDGSKKYRLASLDEVISASPNEGQYILYHSSAAEDTQLPFCEVQNNSVHNNKQTSSNARSAAMATCHVIEVATESDYELYQKYSSNEYETIIHVLDQFNIVEGIYLNSGIDLSFAIVYQNVWTTSSDPYIETLRFPMRAEFKSVWNDPANGFSNIDRDVSYMVSGKVNTQGGAAYPSTAGDPALAYAVGQEFDSETDEHLIAHEIGHTLSASHDTSAAVCISGNKPASGTMCSFVGTQGFSANSVSEISTYLENSTKFGAVTDASIFSLGTINDIRNYVARQTLTLHIQVGNSGYVRAIAGERITLPPGFKANSGSKFWALINPNLDICN